MSNPRSQAALENARVQALLSRFWCCFDDVNDHDALQTWTEDFCKTGCRIMDLNVNHRSGGDIWYSDVLASCREGNMSVCDWQYLHGLPTNECGSWLVRQNRSLCGNHHCAKFKEIQKQLAWKNLPSGSKKQNSTSVKFVCRKDKDGIECTCTQNVGIRGSF